MLVPCHEFILSIDFTRNRNTSLFFTILFLFFCGGCQKLSEPFSPKAPEDNSILDGPVEGLTPAQKLQFLAGDVAFNDDVFTTETGLGPCFVATSCGSCHAGDGKGHPFTSLIRFGQSDTAGNTYTHLGGPQLQNRAIPGFQPEVLPPGVPFSTFTPPANTGLGYLEALTDEQILANADPDDLNGDGISGRPNYVHAPSYFLPSPFHQPKSGKFIGRFGKKASSITLLHQTAKAYNQDMGIISIFESKDPYLGIEGDPEILSNTVHAVVFYLQTLKAPIQRNPTDPEILSGKELFIQIGCGSCHFPDFKTGSHAIEALANKEFHPYTDLLLHDMGPNLDDRYSEGIAYTSEWKTPPLWGLGLAKNSQGGKVFLLHDGRARSIPEAILFHGGEGEISRQKFQALAPDQRNNLIKFLESL